MSTLSTKIDAMVNDETLATAILLERLGRQAIGVLGNLMYGAESEPVKLAAAKDLADRSHETAKTQKLHVESFTMSGKDASALASAMVEAARVKESLRDEVNQNYIRLDGGLDGEQKVIPPPSEAPIIIVSEAK